MEEFGEEFLDGYSDIELDEATKERLDRDPQNYDEALPLGTFEFGSDEYCKNFKRSLSIESKRRTGHTPFAWQLEVALNCHLGRDGFLLAGTGSGKTLAMIALTFLDKRHRVFMISPLNALANAQVKQFEDWGLKAVAVNATTRYKDLFKDIKNGKFQIIISSIEAFLDPTRLLPIVKSPELAALGPQIIIIDEAHCIVKWGPHFRPQYANIGTLKLLLTGESPFIAATATANRLMQEAIKQSLRFGPDSFEINLGNRRSNIAYSVHRLKNVSAAADEVLDYFRSRSHIDGFTLIYVDSRKTGNQILYKLRKHFESNLRGAVQLYHATRSEYDKTIMAAGFELEDGFLIIICTEALTMGIDYRKVRLVIQVMAPTDAETLLQRMGRCGRDATSGTLGQAVLMVQDSVFEDSKAGQKRLIKNMKKEDAPVGPESTTEAIAEKTAKDKARRVPREVNQAVLNFVNATGCRMDVLDKIFDNPPRPEGEVCSCDNCLRNRGEPTFRERLLADHESSFGSGEGAGETSGPGNQDEDTKAAEPSKAKSSNTQKSRPVPQRAPFVDALNNWVDQKYSSAECRWWDITKDWILTEKQIKAISMHPGMTCKADLKTIKPHWVHWERWGSEVFQVLEDVERKLLEEKAREAEEKARKTEEKRQANEERRLNEQRQREETRKRKAEEETQQQTQHTVEANSGPVIAEAGPSSRAQPQKRMRLKADATPEERAAHEQRMKERKKASNKASYQRRKAATKQVKQEVIDQVDALGPRTTGDAEPLQLLLPQQAPLEAPNVTLEAKQEQVDDLLLGDNTGVTAAIQATPAPSLRAFQHYTPAPTLPPASTGPYPTPDGSAFAYTWVTEDTSPLLHSLAPVGAQE